MQLHGNGYSRRELLRRVGNLAQVGGVELVSYEDGHARGVRGVQVQTGSGLRFAVVPDRGLDVGPAEFQGAGLCWLPPKGLAGPWYYEGDLDNYSWLRVGLGGLFNTAGLVSIGVPQTIDTSGFGFTQRLEARYGTHDRIAVTPASRFSYGEDWHDDRCELWVEGIVRQDVAYGEHLTLTRRYSTELGATSFRLVDVVTNEGWFETPHQLLYHFNIGFPIVSEGTEVLASVIAEPADMSFTTDTSAPAGQSGWNIATAPVPGFTQEAYLVPMRAGPDGKVAVAIVNRRLRSELGGLGVYLRYDQQQLPTYIAWRMMREGLYAIGMEPATNPFGNPVDLIPAGHRIVIGPGEQRTYELEVGVLVGGEAIDDFARSLPS